MVTSGQLTQAAPATNAAYAATHDVISLFTSIDDRVLSVEARSKQDEGGRRDKMEEEDEELS